MSRLIDADEFIKWLDVGHLRSPSEVCYSEGDVKVMIDIQPTVDPVVHGRWNTHMKGMHMQCSECLWGTSFDIPLNYCPNCGAKMDGGNNNEMDSM